VHEIEGRIGTRLLPTGNSRLPRARWSDAKTTVRRRRAARSASPPAAA
jgi:hypothetical protein